LDHQRPGRIHKRLRAGTEISAVGIGDRRQAEFLGVAQIIDHRLLLRLADAIGRPLLRGEIDLQMLMGENPALHGRDISGHGPDHCCNPIFRHPLHADYRTVLRFG
jgi:hypothetical protein